MLFIGIDVTKDKHDCFITSSEGEVLADVFTITNSRDGFEALLQTINTCTGIDADGKIKVGLEATGHYSYNLLGFLLDNGLPTYVINPLHTNLYRKSLSLRKTKTDRMDARTITSMLMSDVSLKPYTNIAYHNSELKSLTRYRFDKVSERAALKTSVTRLVNILFPNLNICCQHFIRLLKAVTTETKLFKSAMQPEALSAHICLLKHWNLSLPLSLSESLTTR